MKKQFNLQEIERALGDISGLYNGVTGAVLMCGLSKEKIPLSEKVKLGLIANKLDEHYKVYQNTKKDLISATYPKGLTKELENKLQMSGDKKYLKMMASISDLYIKDKFDIEFQPVSIKKIDSLVSENDYSWLMSKIGE